jgi:anti-sigma factor RsiW
MRGDHVADALLIRAMDDELNESETLEVESHLALCDECARRRQRWRHLSATIESAIGGAPIASSRQRDRLERELEVRETAASAKRSSPALRRLSWALAIAAAVAFALMFVPQWKRAPNRLGGELAAAVQPGAFDVDGEHFLALPYSNPDLPLNTAQIVQMQVPVSALADAGIVFEPISNEIASRDSSVRADVLLGIDGRPVGIHVLSNE